MNTLADEFLADISDVKAEAAVPTSDTPPPEVQKMEVDITPQKITDVAHLLENPKLHNIIKQIETFSAETKTQLLEDDPEYELIVASNEMSAQIFEEILLIHKFTRDIYSKKFPELEQLVQHPLDYARVVQRLKNNTSSANIEALSDILPNSNIITISMAASNTTGTSLENNDIQRVHEACEIALKIDEHRQKNFKLR